MADFTRLSDLINLRGWSYKPEEVEKWMATSKTPFFATSAYNLKGTGTGKVALLYRNMLKVRGSWPYYTQQIGDCVGHGYARIAMLLMCNQILRNGSKTRYKGDVSSEWIYGHSRVEIGRRQLGNQDGSCGAWANESVKHGFALRKQYKLKNGKTLDLTKYDPDLAKTWGYSGVPDELEIVVAANPIQTTSLITSYAQCVDSIANDFPVAVCSNQGFNETRDKDGFCRPYGSWGHCMTIVAIDDNPKRPGALIDNSSWPRSYCNGPKRYGDEPDSSFWADADVVDKMLSREPDSYAVSDFINFPKASFVNLG